MYVDPVYVASDSNFKRNKNNNNHHFLLCSENSTTQILSTDSNDHVYAQEGENHCSFNMSEASRVKMKEMTDVSNTIFIY